MCKYFYYCVFSAFFFSKMGFAWRRQEQRRGKFASNQAFDGVKLLQ